jgi:Cellulose binding domain
MAEHNTAPGWAERGGRVRRLSGDRGTTGRARSALRIRLRAATARLPGRQARYPVVATAGLAAALVAGAAIWAAVHRSASATAVRTVTHWTPVPRQPAAPLAAGDPGRSGARGQPPGTGGTASGRPGGATSGGPVPGGGPVQGPPEPPLPLPPDTPTAALTVRFHASTRWDGGLVGYFAITNTTTAAVDGWRLVVTVPSSFDVTAAWEARMHRTGNTITFTPTSTVAHVDVGATVQFGLQASTPQRFDQPGTCMINDAACA